MATQVDSVDRRNADISHGIIDCDVHPVVRGQPEALFEYMTPSWRKHFELGQFRASNLGYSVKTFNDGTSGTGGGRFRHPTGRGGTREGTIPYPGERPGSDPDHMARQLLDTFGVSSALLVPFELGISGYVNADEAAVVVAALNDYFIEHWLSFDSRYRLAANIAPQDPQKAAAEIRRIGSHEQVAAILLAPINILIGSRYYDPIYEAASEFDLPIALHVTGADGNLQGSPVNAGGMHSTMAAFVTSLPQYAMSQMQSLVFEGAFPRFPHLRVAFLEWGWTWVPSALWRMDAVWREYRLEVPWVRRPPSEYVGDHVRFGSQPAEEAPRADYLQTHLEMVHADRSLLYCSDYPHYDSDDADRIFRKVPTELRQRIFRENALATFPRMV